MSQGLLQYFDDLLVHSKFNFMVYFIEIIRMLQYCRNQTINRSQRDNIYKKYIKEYEYELRHISCKKNDTIHTVNREDHDTKCSGNHALHITYNNIRQDYYFKDIFSIIKRYIKSCATCQLNINSKDNGILQSLEIPFEVWRDISIDLLSKR
ncbi:hypothetical protein ACTFIR_003792 [Dictyostelium discoideum]